MIPGFHVSGSKTPRPESRRTIFADGSADQSFREGTDLELSHWVPNRTPARYKADTSTEIALNFAADPLADDFELAENNHLDVDGMLSLYALVHAGEALGCRDAIIGAAEIGDFSAWAERPSQRLFQGLTVLLEDARAGGTDVVEVYAEAFRRVPDLLEGCGPEDPRLGSGLEALDRSVERIESGRVAVTSVHERFTMFRLPRLKGDELDSALRVPEFNALIDDSVWLWPQARNRAHGQAVHLVSVEASDGFYHDLWYPGYMWAETPDRWRAPGLEFSGSTNGYLYAHRPLERAARELRAAERATGRWVLATQVSPFGSIEGRSFPVMLSFLGLDGAPATSALDPEAVGALLAGAFAAT